MNKCEHGTPFYFFSNFRTGLEAFKLPIPLSLKFQDDRDPVDLIHCCLSVPTEVVDTELVYSNYW